MDDIRIIIEQDEDGYVAYAMSSGEIIVGYGETYEEAVAEVTSSLRFHTVAAPIEV